MYLQIQQNKSPDESLRIKTKHRRLCGVGIHHIHGGAAIAIAMGHILYVIQIYSNIGTLRE